MKPDVAITHGNAAISFYRFLHTFFLSKRFVMELLQSDSLQLKGKRFIVTLLIHQSNFPCQHFVLGCLLSLKVVLKRDVSMLFNCTIAHFADIVRYYRTPRHKIVHQEPAFLVTDFPALVTSQVMMVCHT